MIICKIFFHLFLVLSNLLCQGYALEARSVGGAAQIRCMWKERQALLKFKQELTHVVGLSSWASEEYQHDCCKWRGVRCDNQTGNVIGLNLRGSYSSDAPLYLSGNISHSLIELKYLEYLDLSSNSFYPSNVPKVFGSFRKLKCMKLSHAGFCGKIPHELRNLSSLQTLDLRSNYLSVDSLEWLLPLSSLRNLHLKGVNLNKATDWLKTVSNLPLLRGLDLSACGLLPVPPSLPNPVNFSTSIVVLDLSLNHLDSSLFACLFNYSDSLTYVDFSSNSLRGPIPDDLAMMVSLVHLDLSHNKIEGGIPSFFGNYSTLKSLLLHNTSLTGHMPELIKNLSGQVSSTLEYLNLGENLIGGPLPDTIAEFPSLKYLSLRSNKLNGSIPEAYGKLEVLDFTDNEISDVVPDFFLSLSLRELYLKNNNFSGTLTENIGRLSNLEKLYLGSNHFEGIISESHLLNLSQLQVLDLSFNSHLEFRFPSNWIPPFQLEVLNLRNCTIGPYIPKWLQTQTSINEIDISDARISGTIPSWLWNQMSTLKVLNLSHNLLGGTLPELYGKVNHLSLLDLSSNGFEGPIPRFPNNIKGVFLSKNRFSRNITFLCSFPYENLFYLDLSDNQLSGHLSDCWGNLDRLLCLNLKNNHLSGKLPPSMGSLRMLMTLQLRKNKFIGEVPRSWRYFTQMNFIDLGHNRLHGSIPLWEGIHLSNVVVLDFSSNNFSGKIPKNVCNLPVLQILDLSENKISGAIPKCISNLTAMTQKGSSPQSIGTGLILAEESELHKDTPEALLMWKGKESQYKSTLALLKIIDLSSNNLTGDIPIEITALDGLVGLNLSRNHLTGILMPQIGNLQSLDVLDLSSNHLSGQIPSNLSQLSKLGKLDLSYNNFVGRIPPNTRLQTYEASAFLGNPGLCGEPLTQACPGDMVPRSPTFNLDEDENEDKLITKGFYLSMMLGFIFGFWGVCGVLFFNRSSRHSFFKALKEMEDWLCTITALKLARLRRRFQR